MTSKFRGLAALVAVVAVAPAAVLNASASAQQAPSNARPVSIYSLDDGSAADSITSEDPSGTATPTGQVFGNPRPTADRHGNPTGALLFNGSGDYIQTKENSNKNPLTFSVWFRADDVSSEHSIIDSDKSGQFGHSLIIGYDNPRTGAKGGDGTLDVQYHDDFWDSKQKIEAGTWYQAFVTYSEDAIKLYLGTASSPMKSVGEHPYPTNGVNFDGSDFRFGHHNPGDPQFFKGAMDDIRFYEGALTPAEITEVGGPNADPDTTTTAPTGTTETTAPADSTTTVPVDENDRRAQAVPPTSDPDEATTTTTTPPVKPPVDVAKTRASTGDVHLRTLDGLVFDFQEVGDYIAVRSDDYVLQARQSPYDKTPNVSINTGVAMKVGDDTIEFSQDPADSLFVNGEQVDFPTKDLALPAGGKIVPNGDKAKDVIVVLPTGERAVRVVMQRSTFIDYSGVRVGSGSYGGILGNHDGDRKNDLRTQGGQQIDAPASVEQLKAWGDSWLVGDDESLFRAPNPHKPSVEPTHTVLGDFPDEDAKAAEATCKAAGVTEEQAVDACVYDITATGDEGFVDSALLVQDAQLALPEAERAITAAVGSKSKGVSVPILIGVGLAVLALIALMLKFATKKPAVADGGGASAPAASSVTAGVATPTAPASAAPAVSPPPGAAVAGAASAGLGDAPTEAVPVAPEAAPGTGPVDDAAPAGGALGPDGVEAPDEIVTWDDLGLADAADADAGVDGADAAEATDASSGDATDGPEEAPST